MSEIEISQPPLNERLYHLLPAIYRIRDEIQGGQLRALLSIVESELRVVESDIDALYDNWFIETCEEWVVPYIGDLLAVQELNAQNVLTYGSQERRASIANTLAYRQRKGTTAVLEQLARDITGWYARAVEPFQLLATTQNINHVRPNAVTVDVRGNRQPERLGTPFEQRAAYTSELRSPIARGRYNLSSIALYLWRLQAYTLDRATPQAVKGLDEQPQGRYFRFQAVGDRDIPLFNPPQTETDITSLAQEMNVPGLLTRSLLQEYISKQFPLQVAIDGQTVQTDQIVISDLTDWTPKTDSQTQRSMTSKVVAVDPELGRLTILSEELPKQVEVSYTYGFSGDVGGGVYTRSNSVAEQVRSMPPTSEVRVWNIAAADAREPNPIASAIHDWNRTAEVAQHCYDKVLIPLSRLSISPDGTVTVLAQDINSIGAEIRPQFSPGIVKGLDIIASTGGRGAIVCPGTAIDRNGDLIWLRFRYRVSFRCYRNQTVFVTICYRSEYWLPRWQVRVVSESELGQYPPQAYLQLAKLAIDDQGQITQIDTRVRQSYSPGIIRGLQVEEPASLQLTLSPGKVINRQGKVLSFRDSTSFNLNAFWDKESPVNHNILLFVTPRPAPEPPQLGAIRDIETGIVYIQGNLSYVDDLTVQIPAGKRFWLLAANGDRPHLKGNLTVQSLATTEQNFSEFLVEGVLLEGKFTIAPGSLERLQISHATLVPQLGGITVQPPEFVPPKPDESISLLAILFYGLAIVQQLFTLGFGKNGLSPQERLARLGSIARQQAAMLLEALRQACEQFWQFVNQPKPDPESLPVEPLFPVEPPDLTDRPSLENSQLAITIHRSICGAIALPDPIPSLTITDSIIDAAIDPDSESVTIGAISAPGATATIQTSTVLGTTTLRSLEASNSLFTETVSTLRRQVGCLRFCYVPESSQTPQRYRCQPDLTLSEQITRRATEMTDLATIPTTQQLFAATLGTGIFQFIESVQRWLPFNEGLTNLNVTALCITNETLFAGTTGGTVLQSLTQTKSGTGTIAVQENRITGTGTFFTQEAIAGDTIIFADQPYTILEVESDITLTIDRATDSQTQAIPFQITHRQWVAIDPAFAKTDITAIVTNGTQLVVGTAGEGVFLSTDGGTQWTAINTGLNDLEIRAIALHESHWLVGTRRGVFYSSDNGNTWTQPQKPAESEQPSSPPLQITALAIDPMNDDWYAGTVRTGLFRSIDQGQHWTPINRNLSNLAITALLVTNPPGTGTITTQGTQVTGSETIFSQEVAIGDAITINGQTRIVTAIDSTTPDTLLTIETPFDLEVSEPMPFTLTSILAGTADGSVFRSTNLGTTWQKVSTGLTETAITVLLALEPTRFVAGTRVGSVYRSVDGDSPLERNNQRWISINAGLNQVDRTLQILNQMQPRFTSIQYGDAGYVQLNTACPLEIRTGAEDGSEIGVFNDLKQPQRAENLRASLREYLRFGLEADIVFIT